MKESISDFLVYSLSHDFDEKMSSKILYYERYPELHCSKNIETYVPYSSYEYHKKVTESDILKNVMFRVIFGSRNNLIKGKVYGCGVNINKTKLFLVPTITLSDAEETRIDTIVESLPLSNTKIPYNPPILPYIDVDETVLYLKFSQYFDQIKNYIDVFKKDREPINEEYESVKARWDSEHEGFNEKWTQSLMKHEYYAIDDTLNELIRDKDLKSVNITLTKQILAHIIKNNGLTTLGTLNFVRFQTVLNRESGYHELCKEGNTDIFDTEKSNRDTE